MSDIKNIVTFTLSDKDEVSKTYDECIDFLINTVPNRGGRIYFTGNSFNLEGKSIVLFKYKGKLVAKGVITSVVDDKGSVDKYNGYYIVEDIKIFKSQVTPIELNKYVNEITKLTRDQYIDIKYLEEVNQLIKDFTGEIPSDSPYDCSVRIIKNFINKNNLELVIDEQDKSLFSNFKRLYSPEVLKSLDGIDVLNSIFPQKGNKSNLCYALEFSNEFKWLCGGIRGGSTFKFSLFKYSETNKWTVGSAKSNLKTLTESEAIELAIKIRDAIVKGAEYIENNVLESIDDYILLEEDSVLEN